jgi:hypothetical protein
MSDTDLADAAGSDASGAGVSADEHRLIAPPPRRRRRRWLPLLLTSALLAGGSAVVLNTGTLTPDERPPAGEPSDSRPVPPDDLPRERATPPRRLPLPVLPQKFTGGYIETWYDQRIEDVPAEYDVLFSAFARIDGEGRATYTHGDGQSRAAFIAGIADRRMEGKPVILSIGGAGGSAVSLEPGPQVENFLTSVQHIIDDYGFSGIDWDLENDLPDGQQISVPGLVEISKRLHATYGASFIISMAPYGEEGEGTDATYLEVARQTRGILDFVGYQHYNADSPPTALSVRATMERWMATAGLRPEQWSLGFLERDDGQGFTTSYAQMIAIYQEIDALYPTVRGVWTWGVYEKDLPAGYPFVRSLAPVIEQSG